MLKLLYLGRFAIVAVFHCDHLSTYLARMISHNRADPVRHSNFFSSALNELLEVSFRGGTASGQIGLSIYRHGPVERVQITFPCPAEQVPFSRAELDSLMALAEAGIGELTAMQKAALSA